MFPWIGEQSYIEMLFRQFSNLTTYVSVFGKLLYQHFNLSLFSNPGVKVLILVESMVQICPLVFFLYFLLSKMIYWNVGPTISQQRWHAWLTWKIVRTTLQCMVVLQSKGKESSSCSNSMKPGSQSPTYALLFSFNQEADNPTTPT